MFWEFNFRQWRFDASIKGNSDTLWNIYLYGTGETHSSLKQWMNKLMWSFDCKIIYKWINYNISDYQLSDKLLKEHIEDKNTLLSLENIKSWYWIDFIQTTQRSYYAGYNIFILTEFNNKEWNDKNDWKRYNKDNAVIIGLVICYFAINYVWIVLHNDTLKYDYNLIDLPNQ